MEEKKVKVGNLYLCEYSEERKIEIYDPPAEVIKKHPAFLFDKRSGNVHMLPANIDIAKTYSNTICNKRTEINKHIKHYLSENNKYSGYKGISPKNLPNPGSILNGTSYEPAKYLFSYLCVIGDSGVKYDLIFNRFFIENDQVNCILLCFQIKMYPKNPKNKKEPRSIDYYPDISPDGKIMENEVYYNLDVDSEGKKIDINSDAEDIAKAFLEFVLKKEAENNERRTSYDRRHTRFHLKNPPPVHDRQRPLLHRF